MITKKIEQLKIALSKVDLTDWEFSGNYPFYVNMEKPRNSLSKHDNRSPSYWHWDDGNYAILAARLMPELLKYIEELQEKVKDNGKES